VREELLASHDVAAIPLELSLRRARGAEPLPVGGEAVEARPQRFDPIRIRLHVLL
jgi:hypothetical protein